MKQSFFKTALLSAVAITSISPALAAGFNISGGDLKTALDAYAKQSGVALMYSVDAVKGIQTKGVTGDVSSDTALTRILSGTGLSVREESGAMVIIPRRSSANIIQPLQLAQAAPSGRIEEVLVTARRREEAVENIPISITALSAEDLKTFGIRNFADLEGVVPGLNLGGGGNGVKRDSSPFIRGVGQRETKVTLDPAVATYIDGVYIGRAAGAMMDVTDVSSIQVLRGPQGTLFGRNATGGAISVNLNKPTNEWEGNVSVNIGNYGRRDISGLINVPFMEDFLMGRLFISSVNSNGYFTNIVDNAKWGGDNRITGIAQLRFQPTDRITVDVLGERTRIRETPRPQRCSFLRNPGFTTDIINFMNGTRGYDPNTFRPFPIYENACRASRALPPSRFASDLSDKAGSLMPKGRYWVDTSTASATANWDVGDLGFLSDFNIKNIAAWRKTKQIADEDLDAISEIYLIRIQPYFDETTQISEELQLSGKTLNDRLFLSTGFYYFKEKTPVSDIIVSAGIGVPGFQPAGSSVYGPIDTYSFLFGEPAKERLRTDNKSYAWYAQADFDVTSEIQITGGIRWTREERWSGYSKAYGDPWSLTVAPIVPNIFNGVYATALSGGAITGVASTQPGIRPVLDWFFASREYFFTGPTPPAPVDWRYVDKFIGDELSTADEAWTPMFSVKYNASDSVLQVLGLDQAMVYATYSQGFHAGGVTAGAVDYDRSNQENGFFGFNSPATTGIPCPSQINANAFSCVTYMQLPEPGYGTADPQIFRPEKVTNYEIGAKFAGLDRRLQANLSAFWMNYTDMQTTGVGDRLGIPVPFIENVGKSVIKGIEAEFVIMPTPQWRIFMNGSYTDADIKEWQSRVNKLSFTGAPTNVSYTVDRSDERMVRVPRWQFFGSTEYNFKMGTMGSITPSVGVRFTSSIYHGFDRGSWVYTQGGRLYNHNGDMPPDSSHSDWWQDPNAFGGRGVDPLVTPTPNAKWETTSRPTAFLDARLTWNSEDGRLEAALWGKNLTNQDDYLVGGIPLVDITGATGQVYANPRTFGLTFTYHFGE